MHALMHAYARECKSFSLHGLVNPATREIMNARQPPGTATATHDLVCNRKLVNPYAVLVYDRPLREPKLRTRWTVEAEDKLGRRFDRG